MIKNTQLTDLGAVSAEFPYGFPKNESSAGANDGTLLNSDYLNDMFQLFQRAVALSGITPNELLDNATNGYQLFDACFGAEWKEVGNDGGATVYINGATGETGSVPDGVQLRYRKTRGGKYIHLNGWVYIADTSLPAFSMPVSLKPSYGVRSACITSDSSLGVADIYSTNGNVIVRTSGPAGVYVNVEYPID